MNQQKGFYKNFFNIYVALVLQNIITISVNLADNVMLGAYSETALSGAAAVNQIQFVYQQLLLALGDGLVIFCSQYWGKKQTGPMKKIAAIAMYAAIFIAVVLFGLVSFFPYQAVGIFTTDRPIIEAGVSYLNVIRFTYLIFCNYADTTGNNAKCRDSEDSISVICDDILCKLRNQLCIDFRAFWGTGAWNCRSSNWYFDCTNYGNHCTNFLYQEER